jgi:hypothetical protein
VSYKDFKEEEEESDREDEEEGEEEGIGSRLRRSKRVRH